MLLDHLATAFTVWTAVFESNSSHVHYNPGFMCRCEHNHLHLWFS